MYVRNLRLGSIYVVIVYCLTQATPAPLRCCTVLHSALVKVIGYRIGEIYEQLL